MRGSAVFRTLAVALLLASFTLAGIAPVSLGAPRRRQRGPAPCRTAGSRRQQPRKAHRRPPRIRQATCARRRPHRSRKHPVARKSPVSPKRPPARQPVFPPVPSPSPPVASPVPSAAPRLFSPTSVWNQALSANAPLDPNSVAIVGHLNDFVNTSEAARAGPWINTTDSSTPIYTVPADQPTVPVYTDYPRSITSAFAAVPIPTDAEPAAGTDAEMTVYQPSSDTLWEMFEMAQRLDPPPSLSAVIGTGGSLPAAGYAYAVTALTAQGETTLSPIRSPNVPAGGKVTLQWSGPTGSSGYNIYRGADVQHLQLIQTIAHQTTQFADAANTWTDDGSFTSSGIGPPTTNTAATPGQWHAQWGGRMLHVSADPGYYRNVSDPLGGFDEYAGWGATASSLPVAAGLITLADLASGQIDHALAMLVPRAKAGIFYCPAQRTDGSDSSPDAIPEGAHFRLDPTLDLSKLQMPPVTRMIAEAAQKYGLIVNDQTGATVGFRAEDPTPLMRQSLPNPYVKYFTDPATGRYAAPNQFLAAFPWSALQLLAPPSTCS
jgi:hypothetical protein